MSLWVITGGAGFIGSNIAADLIAAGHDVVIIDRLRQAASGKWRNIARLPVLEIVHPDATFDWLDGHAKQISGIIHMGAISSTTEPDADLIIHNNFTLSQRLCAWCAQHGKRLIYASSAATYGDGAHGFADDPAFNAHNQLSPLNAYGYSKKLFDLHVLRQRDCGHTLPPQWAGLKFFNVYGPNEYHKGSMQSVVAHLFPKARQSGQVSLFKSYHADYADGGQLRDFVSVRDCARVVSWLVDTPSVSGIFNVGSGSARSFADLARATCAAIGVPADIQYIDMPEALRGTYQYYTQADLTHLRAAGYLAAMTTLEDGVGDYVQRYLMQDDPYL